MERLGTNMRLLLDPDKLETNFNMTLKRFPLKEYNCSVTFLFSYFLNHSPVQKNLLICGKTCGRTWSYFWTMWGKEWSDLSTHPWVLVCILFLSFISWVFSPFFCIMMLFHPWSVLKVCVRTVDVFCGVKNDGPATETSQPKTCHTQGRPFRMEGSVQWAAAVQVAEEEGPP